VSTKFTTTEVTRALGALAQETRLELFRMLVERGPAGLSAGELAERLKVPSSSLSFHLRALQHAHLITQRRASRQMIYAADFGSMNAVVQFLTENCCGAEAVCAPVCNPGAALAAGENQDDAAVRRRRR
jgi:ArsR family transcriptional regulator, arsenate/arsenite/antimonite-responsive transcriptional repressor